MRYRRELEQDLRFGCMVFFQTTMGSVAVTVVQRSRFSSAGLEATRIILRWTPSVGQESG